MQILTAPTILIKLSPLIEKDEWFHVNTKKKQTHLIFSGLKLVGLYRWATNIHRFHLLLKWIYRHQKYIVFVSKKSYLFVNTLHLSVNRNRNRYWKNSTQRHICIYVIDSIRKTFLYPIFIDCFYLPKFVCNIFAKYHFTVKSLIWRVYLRRRA